jgi:hypothetical protein
MEISTDGEKSRNAGLRQSDPSAESVSQRRLFLRANVVSRQLQAGTEL